jgi:putative addiction module killer protein
VVTQTEGSASCCASAGEDRSSRRRQPRRCEAGRRGISELRIAYGPGYRVYYLQEGRRLIVLLCGGDKSIQQKDIEDAKRIAADWKLHGRQE